MPTLRTYAGGVANTTYTFTEGIYFTVNSTITVTDLGIFAPSAAAPPSGVTMSVWLANRSASTTILATTTFTNASPGTADATNNILSKSVTPVELAPGNYCVWEGIRPVTYQMQVYPGAGSQPVDSTMSGAVTVSGSYYHPSSTTLMPTTSAGAGNYYGGPTLIATVGGSITVTSISTRLTLGSGMTLSL